MVTTHIGRASEAITRRCPVPRDLPAVTTVTAVTVTAVTGLLLIQCRGCARATWMTLVMTQIMIAMAILMMTNMKIDMIIIVLVNWGGSW